MPTFEEFANDNIEFYFKSVLSEQYRDLINSPINTKEHYLYRGFDLDNEIINGMEEFSKLFRNAKPGDIIVPDWCTMCTSQNPYVAKDYVQNGLLRIKTPIGARLCAKSTYEINLPSLSKFKFLGKQQVGEFEIYDLEYIMLDLSDIDKFIDDTFKEFVLPKL